MTDDLKERGCTCFSHPPCSFCMELTEEEASILWNGTMRDLEKYWHEQALKPDEEENQWVVLFDYER